MFFAGISMMTITLGCKGRQAKTDYMELARKAASCNQFQLAKAYIDSVRVQEPDNYSLIRESRVLLHDIEFAEQQRTRDYCDSLLKVRQAEFPLRQKDFIFQQNKDYGNIGYYVNIRQQTTKNANRTYLQARVEEDGKLLVTSYYCGGASLSHTRLRIYSKDGSFVETLDVPKDGFANYAFSDEDANYEMVRFNEKRLNGLLDFIKIHADEALKVELEGTRNKTYTLENQDKQAILGAAELSVVLSDINRLLNEIRLAQAKMNYLASKKAEKESDTQ